MKEINIPTAVIHEVKPSDWIAGVSSNIPFEIVLEDGNWIPYARTKERQYPPESFCCVSFSGNHAIDAQINRLIDLQTLPTSTLVFLSEKGYLDDFGHFNSSDIFTAILSKTSKQGNSQQDVLDSMDDVGLIPESILPFGKFKTWEELMNPKRITPEMKALGLEFLKHFKIQYEWVKLYGDGKNLVETFKKELQHAPIQITAPVCSGWNQDIPKTCSMTVPQHATLVLKVDDYFRILDQYEPFFKALPKDYPILYGMKIVLTTVKDEEEKFRRDNPQLSPEVTKEQFSYRQRLFRYFVKLFTGKEFVGALPDNNIIMKNLYNWLVWSSVNKDKVSLTIKGALTTLSLILVAFGYVVTSDDITALAGSFTDIILTLSTLISTIVTVYGLVRKIRNTKL